MNLNIPIEDGKTTEIDLLMIHETGIYVFEIKHYKGTIYEKIQIIFGHNILGQLKTALLEIQ